MHVVVDELRALANQNLKNEILSDRLLQVKRHIAECDSCYGKFCAEYVLLKKLGEASLILPDTVEAEEPARMFKVFLRIEVANDRLDIESGNCEQEADCWKFIRMPQFTVLRGGGERQVKELYINQLSQYSCIERRDGKILIQLDGDFFAVEQLAVSVTGGEHREIYEFSYNTKAECYQVLIDEETMPDGAVIEIIEK